MNLDALINNLETFDFEKEQTAIITANKDTLADLQAQQFAMGKDAKGQPIELIDNPEYGYGYRPYTIFKKQSDGVGLGKITDRVTMFQSGRLYKEMTVNISVANSTYEIASKVPYWSALSKRVQTDALKLNEDNRRQFAEGIVLPNIEQRLNDALKG